MSLNCLHFKIASKGLENETRDERILADTSSRY